MIMSNWDYDKNYIRESKRQGLSSKEARHLYDVWDRCDSYGDPYK